MPSRKQFTEMQLLDLRRQNQIDNQTKAINRLLQIIRQNEIPSSAWTEPNDTPIKFKTPDGQLWCITSSTNDAGVLELVPVAETSEINGD